MDGCWDEFWGAEHVWTEDVFLRRASECHETVGGLVILCEYSIVSTAEGDLNRQPRPSRGSRGAPGPLGRRPCALHGLWANRAPGQWRRGGGETGGEARRGGSGPAGWAGDRTGGGGRRERRGRGGRAGSGRRRARRGCGRRTAAQRLRRGQTPGPSRSR
jgi:hypothetical protein